MFKHHAPPPPVNPNSAQAKESPPTLNAKLGLERAGAAETAGSSARESQLKELVEKNLKWSQILYEQNRKINRKLFWLAVSGWLKFFIIAIPLALAIWLLPPFIKRLEGAYGSFLRDAEAGRLSPNSFEQLLQFLPLAEPERAQLKNLIK